jgi:hypothetical protein
VNKRTLLATVFAVSLLLVLSISAVAVEGLLVDSQGLPLEGFSNVYIIDGVPQPVYNYNDQQWYSAFLVGTDESGKPICQISSVIGGGGDKGGGGGKDIDENSPPTKPTEPPACFSGTTLVLMADGSTKMIKDITIGEKVMGYDLAAGRFTSCGVVSNKSTVKGDYYVLDGLEVTAGHPFYARNFGPTPASLRPASVEIVKSHELKPYATLYGFNPAKDTGLRKITLESVVHAEGSGTFYNLQVDGTRNFFVSPDGVIFIANVDK